jgi:lipid-binding SYLF domain-containing protein
MWISRLSAIAVMVLGMACATAPKGESDRRSLEQQAMATLQTMIAKDPGLRAVIDTSVGYAVFPNIGKGGAVVGAAFGRGVLFENGRPSGFVSLSQGSIGAQLGGQSFAELIVFRTRNELQKLKNSTFELGGNASAVALTAGAAASANLNDPFLVFTMPKGGLMAELSVSGQRMNFEPRG